MTARTQQSYFRPLNVAIAAGATTPDPGVSGAVAYSTTTGGLVVWTGTAWASAGAAAGSTALSTATYTSSSSNTAGQNEQGTITLSTGYRLVAVQTSGAARVRLYTSAAKRVADVTRAAGTDPGYNTGNVLDLVTSDNTVYDLTPEVNGHSRETTPTAAIPITVTGAAAGAITVTVTYVGGQ